MGDTQTQSIGGNYSTWWGAQPEVDEHGDEPKPPAGPPPKGNGRLVDPQPERLVLGETRAEISPSLDSFYLAASAIKGHDGDSALDLEVFSVSAKVDPHGATGGGVLAHVGATTDDKRATVGVDILGARASHGIRERGGCLESNVGVMATGIGIEGTLPFGTASSVTAGASISAGIEVSTAIRDIDGDQEPELCGRVSFMWWTLGGCLEMPYVDPSLQARTAAVER